MILVSCLFGNKHEMNCLLIPSALMLHLQLVYQAGIFFLQKMFISLT